MSDLNWALANMDTKHKPESTKWVYEAEAKAKDGYVRLQFPTPL